MVISYGHTLLLIQLIIMKHIKNETGKSDYEEFVFDIKESELQNYDLKVESAKLKRLFWVIGQ